MDYRQWWNRLLTNLPEMYVPPLNIIRGMWLPRPRRVISSSISRSSSRPGGPFARSNLKKTFVFDLFTSFYVTCLLRYYWVVFLQTKFQTNSGYLTKMKFCLPAAIAMDQMMEKETGHWYSTVVGFILYYSIVAFLIW